jgi:hypothetical protein
MNRILTTVISSALISLLAAPLNAQSLTFSRPDSSGFIQSMRIPAGWFKESEEHKACGCGAPRWTIFRPLGQDRVLVYVRAPGHRSEVDLSIALREILAKPIHNLDSGEQKRLALDDDSSTNKLLRTQDLNGRRVLMFERIDKNEPYRDMVIQVSRHDRSRDDDVILEISYRAQADLYSRYLPAANQTFASIVWR